MVSNLLVTNSSYVGSRDLWWVDDPLATKGYNVYRAFDYPTNWIKMNANPWLGHFYRDQVSLEQVTYVVQESDWREKGTFGKWGFAIPDIPYSTVVAGRPMVATSPDDVNVIIDGVPFRPTMVVGVDQTIWLQMDNTLAKGGAVTATAPMSNGNVAVADYSGAQEFKVVYNKLNNYVDIYSTLLRTFYTVVPIGDSGELHSPGALGTQIVNTMEVDKISWEYQEMIRRNSWIFEEIGEPAYLMFRKTRGKICGCRGQETGLNQARTACPICFEVGIVGGYYGPYDFVYVPPDSAVMRELDEGGVKTSRDARSYLTNTPVVQDGDLIIRRNGDRLVINGVIYKSPRGVLLQQDFNTQLLPSGDTRYLIPINTGLPTIFNPVVSRNPLDGGAGNGEPIFDPRNTPDKEPWENEIEIPIGRTITFGKIMT
jgi:hypothetical protein